MHDESMSSPAETRLRRSYQRTISLVTRSIAAISIAALPAFFTGCTARSSGADHGGVPAASSASEGGDATATGERGASEQKGDSRTKPRDSRPDTVHPAEVQIVAASAPTGARSLGPVRIEGYLDTGMRALIERFQRGVAERGGTVGKVDSMRTRFRWERRRIHYNCGSPQMPITCSRLVDVEAAITTVEGRAFRAGSPP